MQSTTMPKLRFIILLILLLIILFVWQITADSPSNSRDWYDFYAKTPDAVTSTSSVTLLNVRNWNHGTSGTLSKDWLDEIEINPTDIESIWFALSRFGNSEVSGHSFLSFELTTGEVYSLSIEARREVGEEYSVFYGLFNQFELWYGWGTERDFLGTRLFGADDQLEYYRLNLTAEEAQAIFSAVARETQSIADNPEFYNTLTANCTNLLAKTINQSYPGRIPYDLAWNLPGRSVEFLHEQALIDPTISVADHKVAATIDRTDPLLLQTIQGTSMEFSSALRKQLE